MQNSLTCRETVIGAHGPTELGITKQTSQSGGQLLDNAELLIVLTDYYCGFTREN